MTGQSPSWSYLGWLWQRFSVIDPPAFAAVDPDHCVYCGVRFQRNHVRYKRTKEHLVPAWDGGILVVPACWFCNNARGGKPVTIFLASPILADMRRKVADGTRARAPVPDDIMLRLHTVAEMRGQIWEVDSPT